VKRAGNIEYVKEKHQTLPLTIKFYTATLSAVTEYTERSKEASNSCLKSDEEALWVGFQMIKENFFIKGH
jgi:hypothetical protein